MKQSTLENHTSNLPHNNSAQYEAWEVAYAIRRWTIWNLVYWFRPPVMHSVCIIPENMDLVDPEDRFEPAMFRPDGFLHTRPLNHYIRLRTQGGKYEFWANAGVLLREFRVSRRNGFCKLRELITCAQEELSKACTTEGCTCNIQEEGSSN